MEKKPHPKGKGCWYKKFIYYCPVCGRDDVIIERQYTKPPPKYSPKRIDWIERWDYCEL